MTMRFFKWLLIASFVVGFTQACITDAFAKGGGGFGGAHVSVPFRAAPMAPRLPSPIVRVSPAAPVTRVPVMPGPRVYVAPVRPLVYARTTFYTVPRAYAPAPAPMVVQSYGPPWWYWYILFHNQQTSAADRRRMEEDRNEWTRGGECYRCHHHDQDGRAKPEGQW